MTFDQKYFQDLFVNKIPKNQDLDSLLEHITPVGKLTTNASLAAYHNDYIARHTEALGDFFESIWMVLGDDDFFALAKTYILETPSISYDLGQYGKSFPLFLAKQNQATDFPFLQDLAQLELDFLQIFHSKQFAPKIFTEKELSQLESMSFTFSTELLLNRSHYPIVSIWKRRSQDLQTQSHSEDIDFNHSEQFLIYKSNQHTYIKVFSKQQYFVLQSLMSGDTVQQSLSNLEQQNLDEANTQDIQDLFKFLMESGIIVDNQ